MLEKPQAKPAVYFIPWQCISAVVMRDENGRDKLRFVDHTLLIAAGVMGSIKSPKIYV